MLNTTKIAIKNLKSQKTKSILLVMTILLSAMLLTAVTLTCLGWNTYNQERTRQYSGTFHGIYSGLNDEEVEQVKTHIDIENVGLTNGIGVVKFEDESTIGLMYLDEVAFEFNQLTWIEGTLPTRKDEIVLDDLALAQLGVEPVLGQIITLTYGDYAHKEPITTEFVLTGIIKANEVAKVRKAYSGIVSENYMRTTRDMSKENFNALVTLAHTRSLSADDMTWQFEKVGNQFEIPKYRMMVNEDYINTLKPDPQIIIAIGVIGLIVILSSVLVIYNIFYLSVVTKVQEFGKLRAIGATKKQIRSIVFKEGMFLSIVGVPLGLMIGYLISEVVVRQILMISEPMSKWPALVGVAVISFITVGMSIAKPMSVASKVSIIEAVRYNGQEIMTQKERKGYQSLNLKRLVLANLARNRKRTYVTILSLSLSGIIFIVMSSVMSSVDAREMARNHFPYDIEIGLTNYTFGDETSPNTEINRLQLNNPLGEAFREELLALEGVNEIKVNHSLKAELKGYETEYRYHDISSVTEDNLDDLELYLEAGTIDLEALKSGEEIIITYAGLVKQSGIKVGDDLTLMLYDGDDVIEQTFKVQAITGGPGTFGIHSEAFEKIVKTDTTDTVGLNTDEKQYESLKQSIQRIADQNEYLEVTFIDTEIEVYEVMIGMIKVIIYSLVLIVGMIGFINFVNTMITSLITRKKELGILQAIGLTDKQLIRMLNLEALFYTMITLISSIFVGGGLGYVAVYAFRKTGGSYATYHLPLGQMLLMVIFILVAQVILTILMSRSFNKQSLIERVRYSE